MKAERQERRGSSSAGIEGRNAVLEALRSGVPIAQISIAEGVKPDRAIDEIARLATEAGIPVRRVARQVLDRVSERGSHQGVVAEAAPFSYAELADLLEEDEPATAALIVVLDHVLDPGNLGAVARSAEVAGARGLVVPNRRSAPVTPAAHKAAAGALAHLPVARVPNLARALEDVKRAGYWVVGATEHADQSLWDAPMEGRLCVVLGGEGTGLSRLVEEHCDFLVSLPVAGHVSSLNVAQAGTAMMFEWVRRTRGGA